MFSSLRGGGVQRGQGAREFRVGSERSVSLKAILKDYRKRNKVSERERTHLVATSSETLHLASERQTSTQDLSIRH